MLVAANYSVVFAVLGVLYLAGTGRVLDLSFAPMLGIAVVAGLVNGAVSLPLLRRRRALGSSDLSGMDYRYLTIVVLVTLSVVLGFRNALGQVTDPVSPTPLLRAFLIHLGAPLLVLGLVGGDRHKWGARQE